MRQLREIVIGVFVVVSIGLSGASAQQGTSGGQWREYGGDHGGMKYSPLDQVAAENIHELEVAWRWPSPDREIQMSSPEMRSTRHEDTPLYIDGVLYTVTPLGLVAALDPATGASRWLHDPRVYENGKPANSGFIHRGLAYWTDGTQHRILLSTNDAYLYSLDAHTGEIDTAFGENGRVDLTTGIRDAVRTRNFMGRRPQIAGDVAIVGNSISDPTTTQRMPPGDVKAFDVRSGRLLWTFHTVPHEYESGYDSWLDGSAEYSGNTNVWAGMTYDPDLDYVYLPVSGPTNDAYGGHRPGGNLFSSALVCVDVKTGERVWHFQAVHHGLWNYDLPAQPVLGDITVDGRRIKAVMLVTKHGFVFTFDRATGEPVWPIEERPVPQGEVPGEWYSPTQPFPSKPPTFTLQGSTEDNLIDFTPELRREAASQLQHFVHGPVFMPPSERGTLYLPGMSGGANWGGGAFDPETSMLYIPSHLAPAIHGVVPGNPEQTDFRYRSGRAPGLAELQRIDGLPLFKPPYSKVTAIDMNRGEIVWEAPIGSGPLNHPRLSGLNLPHLGDEIPRLGVMVTKSLLFVSTQRRHPFGPPAPPPWAEWGDPDMHRKVLYVYDKTSGALLREVELDGQSVAPPMTYMHQGTQYLLMAAGAAEESELVALALASKIGP